MKYVTAGESHGKNLTIIIDDVPAGISLSEDDINRELVRRSDCVGRSYRQAMEDDRAKITAGVFDRKTTGAPVCVTIDNNVEDEDSSLMNTVARPGHADFTGSIKYLEPNTKIARERASARETASRIVAGVIAKNMLDELGVSVFSYVRQIGKASFNDSFIFDDPSTLQYLKNAPATMCSIPHKRTSKKAVRLINKAVRQGNTLGGYFRVIVNGLTPGLGGYAQGTDRLTSKLSASVCSVPAIKCVEFGIGHKSSNKFGVSILDQFSNLGDKGRKTNFAGGLEAGITNGMPLILGAYVKPFSSTKKPVTCFDFQDGSTVSYEGKTRSDCCGVQSAAVIAEGEVAVVIADAYMNKFGHDSLVEIKSNLATFSTAVDHIVGRN